MMMRIRMLIRTRYDCVAKITRHKRNLCCQNRDRNGEKERRKEKKEKMK